MNDSQIKGSFYLAGLLLISACVVHFFGWWGALTLVGVWLFIIGMYF